MNVSAIELMTSLPCRPRSKRPSKPSRRTPPPVYHFPNRRILHSPHSPSPIPPLLRRILRRILLRRRRRTGLKIKVIHGDDGCPLVHHTARYPQAVFFHSKKWNGGGWGVSLGHEASATGPEQDFGGGSPLGDAGEAQTAAAGAIHAARLAEGRGSIIYRTPFQPRRAAA
jgi:hypothetical protein